MSCAPSKKLMSLRSAPVDYKGGEKDLTSSQTAHPTASSLQLSQSLHSSHFLSTNSNPTKQHVRTLHRRPCPRRRRQPSLEHARSHGYQERHERRHAGCCYVGRQCQHHDCCHYGHDGLSLARCCKAPQLRRQGHESQPVSLLRLLPHLKACSHCIHTQTLLRQRLGEPSRPERRRRRCCSQ